MTPPTDQQDPLAEPGERAAASGAQLDRLARSVDALAEWVDVVGRPDDSASDPPSARAGVRTTEFGLAAVAVAAGLALVALGLRSDRADLVEHGTTIVTWATVGYAGARAVVKLRGPGA